LWQEDLTGTIDVWIDVGQPDEKWLRKASGRAKQVFVYSFGLRNAELWWDGVRAKLERAANVNVYNLPLAASGALGKLANRHMQLQCTIQDKQIWFATRTRRRTWNRSN
jgi:uncharacterized protein YaeQ